MGKYLLIIVLFIFVDCLASQETPKVINSEIHFSNTVKISLKNTDVYHVYNSMKRVVVVLCEKKFNFSEYTIYFYDFFGKEISHSEKIIGEIIFKYFDDKGLLLAGQSAMLIKANTSYLFNINGQLIKTITHDYETKEIGVTFDENFFWFVSNQMRPLKEGEKPLYPMFNFTPYNHILLFYSKSGDLAGEYSSDDTTLIIKINGKEYILSFSKPDIPG
jgi:uncharacterized protein YcfL